MGEDFTLYIAAPAKPAAQKKPAPKGMWWFGHSSDVPVKSFELSEVTVGFLLLVGLSFHLHKLIWH